MPIAEPLRGEVWDVAFDFDDNPAVVVSINQLNLRLGHVVVIPVTGTRGPGETHVPLGRDAGLTRYDESYADVTALQAVPRLDLLTQRGRLARAELEHIERQLRTYLGL